MSSLPATTPPAVFISYAREDAGAARRIADALRGFGVEVWFDQNELRGGDAWDAKIKRQIRECALFIAVVSATTQTRGEGYFRREWKLAVERTHDMAASRAFLVPVVIDDTPESEAEAPEEFMRVQWTRLPGGVPTPQFVEQVKGLVEAPLAASRSGTRERFTKPAAENAERPTRLRRPWIWPAVLAVATIGVVAVWQWLPRQGGAEPIQNLRQDAAATSNQPLSSSATAQPPLDFANAKSIAVLAFADLSEARNNEYFSDGISEELLNVLAKIPGLRVAARTSAFFFKGKNVPIPEIAAKLNVAYVVEGSVRRAGDRVRITAQLIKASDGYHVWSENFDREMKDVFAVQDEIAGLIAKNLSLKLGTGSTAASAPINPEAYRLYLEGRQAWGLRTTEGFVRAEQLFQRSLQLDPAFARAHAALSDVWLVRAQGDGRVGRFDQRSSPEIARAVAAAERAVALDPDSAEAHVALGHARGLAWKIREEEREFRLALQLNPNYATGRQWLGRMLMADGRIEEALVELRRAMELDPLSSRITDNYSVCLLDAGRMEQALVFADRALSLQPDSSQALRFKAVALAELGRTEEALRVIRQALELDPRTADYAGYVFARAGAKREAESALAQTGAHVRTVARAATLAALGRFDDCIMTLDAPAIEVMIVDQLYYWPVFDPIRGDARFIRLLATIGLTEAHDRAQAWRAQQKPK